MVIIYARLCEKLSFSTFDTIRNSTRVNILHSIQLSEIGFANLKMHFPKSKVQSETGCADLSLQLLSEFLGFVLFEVVHYHHRSIDLPHRHVGICEGRHTSLSVTAHLSQQHT